MRSDSTSFLPGKAIGELLIFFPLGGDVGVDPKRAQGSVLVR